SSATNGSSVTEPVRSVVSTYRCSTSIDGSPPCVNATTGRDVRRTSWNGANEGGETTGATCPRADTVATTANASQAATVAGACTPIVTGAAASCARISVAPSTGSPVLAARRRLHAVLLLAPC